MTPLVIGSKTDTKNQLDIVCLLCGVFIGVKTSFYNINTHGGVLISIYFIIDEQAFFAPGARL